MNKSEVQYIGIYSLGWDRLTTCQWQGQQEFLKQLTLAISWFFLLQNQLSFQSHLFTCSWASSSCQGIKLWLIGEGGGWGVRWVGGGRVAAPRRPGVEVAATVGGGEPVAAVARHLLVEPLLVAGLLEAAGKATRTGSAGTSRSHVAKYTRLSPPTPTHRTLCCVFWPRLQPAATHRVAGCSGREEVRKNTRSSCLLGYFDAPAPSPPLPPLNLAEAWGLAAVLNVGLCLS